MFDVFCLFFQTQLGLGLKVKGGQFWSRRAEVNVCSGPDLLRHLIQIMMVSKMNMGISSFELGVFVLSWNTNLQLLHTLRVTLSWPRVAAVIFLLANRGRCVYLDN